MQVYATESDYQRYYKTEAPTNFDELVLRASSTIDILTYNRITSKAFLTEYQRNTITECCCEIVNFYNENPDIIDNVLNSYSINGVSMQFNYNSSLCSKNGCIIRRNTYNRLLSTNLCFGVIR